MDYDVLIRGGLIVDGSGKPAYHGDVALRDGKIAYAGPSGKIAGQDNARVIPAEGLVVCPGLTCTPKTARTRRVGSCRA